MATQRFVVYDTANSNQIISLPVSQAEANTIAAGDSDFTAHIGAVPVPDDARPSHLWRFNVADAVVRYIEAELNTDEIISTRRAGLISIMRELEGIIGLAAWTAGEINAATDLSIRAKSYARWVEMMTRASVVDNNLTNESRYAILLREASHPGRVWYWLHYSHGMAGMGHLGAPWNTASSFINEMRGSWIWYSTTGPDADDSTVRIAAADALNPNTRGWVTTSQITTGASQVSLDAGDDFNWIHYLA